MRHPAVSAEIGIVVIGRNEGRRLIDCLVSVAGGTDTVVYVDSGSTDDSVTAAEQAGASVVRLDMSEPFTAGRARNEGFGRLLELKPTVRYVQFVDGDCELAAAWLEAAVAFLQQCSDVAVVCGRRRERHPDSSIYNWLCDVEWNTPIGEAIFCGGDAVMRVEAFKTAHGFRSQLIAGEEPELCVRLRERGWKIWRLDSKMTLHDAALVRFSQWWVRAMRSGHAYAEVFWLHRRSQFGIFRKEVARAIFWGALVPVVIILGALAYAPIFAGALVYPLQICRVALHRKGINRKSFAYAVFMTLAKFAEFQGILKFAWRRLRGHTLQLIEYK
jgi:glycosyltransferase involved in cell wall biosynthesis